jgi:hypothetical protein
MEQIGIAKCFWMNAILVALMEVTKTPARAEEVRNKLIMRAERGDTGWRHGEVLSTFEDKVQKDCIVYLDELGELKYFS